MTDHNLRSRDLKRDGANPSPADEAFRDWLKWQLRDAGCEIRTLSPEGMAEVTVRRFIEEGWTVVPPEETR